MIRYRKLTIAKDAPARIIGSKEDMVVAVDIIPTMPGEVPVPDPDPDPELDPEPDPAPPPPPDPEPEPESPPPPPAPLLVPPPVWGEALTILSRIIDKATCQLSKVNFYLKLSKVS